MKKLKHSSWL